MKLLVFADLHLGKKLGNSYFLDLDKKVIDLVCQEVNRSGIEKIIFLGDLFHTRSESSPKTLGMAREIFDQLNSLSIPIIMILGNHDTYYNNRKDANYYRIFDGLFKNITFVEGVNKEGDFIYVGWMQTPDDEAMYKDLSNGYKWIFGHFEFKGAEVSDYYKTTSGIENENPDSYIFSGHIHQRSQQGRLHYIGSPYPQTWLSKNRGDYGYCRIDTDTEEIRYVNLGLYHFNEYKLQELLMMIHMDKDRIKREMLNSETRVIVDIPLTEKQLSDVKIYLGTFQPKNLFVEKQDVAIISENVSYDALSLSDPMTFITDYITGMPLEDLQKGRIMEKVRGILNQ
jgi:DNA repair exonuclease SbcCD nuclease subunit